MFFLQEAEIARGNSPFFSELGSRWGVASLAADSGWAPRYRKMSRTMGSKAKRRILVVLRRRRRCPIHE